MLDDIDDIKAAHQKTQAFEEDRLTCFFYLLARNELATGAIVELLREVDKCGANEIVYSSPDLANYGREMARRVLGRKDPLQHAWVRHQLDPGAETLLESCRRCGTFRTSVPSLPQDGYDYFEPGKTARPEMPVCKVRA